MAGCYKCGSSDGDDVRLCPSCREERIKSRANVTVSGLAGTAPSPVPPQTTPDQPASEADTIAEPSSEESVDNVGLPIITKVLLAAATMASLAGIYLVGFSVHGPGLFVKA